jgi:hypothetical protein
MNTGNITLSDGTIVPVDSINFDSDTYHFYLNSQDITNLISRADKIANWTAFDPSVDNTRLSNERTGGTGPVDNLPTNTTGIFIDQILTDPLAAPADAISGAIDSVKKSFQSPVTWLVVGGIAVVLLVLYVPRNK